jgi:hypothetical protein
MAAMRTAAVRPPTTIAVRSAVPVRPSATVGLATTIAMRSTVPVRPSATVGLATTIAMRSAVSVGPSATVGLAAATRIGSATATIGSAAIVEVTSTAVKAAFAAAAESLTTAEMSAIVISEASASEVVAVSKTPVIPEAAESVMAEPVAIMEAHKFAMETKAAAHIKRPVEAGVRVVEVVPGPCADKDAVREPLRTVVSVGRAAKRIGGIKPVLAHRGRVVNTVTRPDLHSDCNLRLGIRCRQRQQDQ